VLLAAVISILINVRYSILLTHFWPIASAVIITIAALVVGHGMEGASPEICHAMAIAGAMRNVGFARLGCNDQQDAARSRSRHHYRISLHSVVEKVT
jgi:hypothetical protein